MAQCKKDKELERIKERKRFEEAVISQWEETRILLQGEIKPALLIGGALLAILSVPPVLEYGEYLNNKAKHEQYLEQQERILRRDLPTQTIDERLAQYDLQFIADRIILFQMLTISPFADSPLADNATYFGWLLGQESGSFKRKQLAFATEYDGFIEDLFLNLSFASEYREYVRLYPILRKSKGSLEDEMHNQDRILDLSARIGQRLRPGSDVISDLISYGYNNYGKSYNNPDHPSNVHTLNVIISLQEKGLNN